MRKDWEIKKLEELCEFGNGLWTGKKPPFQKVGVIRNTNFTKDGKLDDTDIVYLDVEQSQFAKRKLQYGDIILEKSGGGPKQPVGRVVIFDKEIGDFSFSNFTSVIRVLNPRKVDFTYLHRFLFFSYVSGATETMQSHSTGIRNLKFDDYKAIEIPLPPLPEQQRIVSILDEAFAAIAKAKANAEQNLKNAKELFESYLQGVFEQRGYGWEENTLGEVCEISSKLIDPKKSEFQDLIHVGAGNIESQKGTLFDLKTAKEENLISGKFLFDESMVLYSKIRPYLMKVVNCNFQGLCSADIYPLLPFKEKMVKDFLYHLLLTKDFTEYAILGSQRAGMPKVNREHLFAYRFYLPPISTQQSIVQKLDALSAQTKKLEAIYQQKINDLEELKKVILQKAFSGELKTLNAVAV
jgi:type I restriction enzyme S subunit